MRKSGALVISLDFELIWGVFDKVNPEEKETYFENTRKVIPEILALFRQYQVHCTWAVVGMLFNDNFSQWKGNFPRILPEYKNQDLSAYRFGNAQADQGNPELYFAKELIKAIQDTPNQEIGTHTYSHYYCLEEGQTLASFRADLEKAIELAHLFEIQLKSLVFPRNQFNEQYLRVCHELGIETVRSNPDDWYWNDTQKDTLLNKIFRTGDAYLGPKNKSYCASSLEVKHKEPIAQKASRLLRPHSSWKLVNDLKLKRVASEMITAAKKAEVYHLWWHPHNFGENPTENLEDLKVILKCFQACQRKYGFQSHTMSELSIMARKLPKL